MLAPPPIEDFHKGIHQILTVHMRLVSLYREKHVNQSAAYITGSLTPLMLQFIRVCHLVCITPKNLLQNSGLRFCQASYTEC